MTTALYARVSTHDKGQEVENQLAELRRFAESQGWRIVAEYVDHESGSRSDRARFQSMLVHAAQHKFDCVLFWSLDRLTREGALQTLQYLNLLTSYGVGYRSFTEPYLDSCGIFKDAVIAILGTIAKQERQRISERVKAGLDRARHSGTKTGRPIGRPKAVFDRDKIMAMRAEGKTMRQIAAEVGVSLGTVAAIAAAGGQG